MKRKWFVGSEDPCGARGAGLKARARVGMAADMASVDRVARLPEPGGESGHGSSEPTHPILRLDIEQHFLAVKLFKRPRFIVDAALLWSRS